MKRKWGGTDMVTRVVLLFVVVAIGVCDGARRQVVRRKEIVPALPSPTPSAETLQALAQAMGAAGFEHYTEGRPLVKRLIPDTETDIDLVEHQGVIGKAGVDFPAFPSIPNTGFNCKNVPTGYYADLETDCQVFHICDTSRKISFLCPNGTIFSQSHLICDWWFKVDCASAPALYESSAEYYSNEQKKTKLNVNNYKTDLQQIGTDTNIRAESRRTTTFEIPTTTERFLRHRQRLQNNALPAPKATARSFQSLLSEQVYPTQRFQGPTDNQSTHNRKQKHLVQLISNFGNTPVQTTQPTYAEAPVYQTTVAPPGDYNSIKEMQVAAETASFTNNNNNRQYLQDIVNKNLRPYPVYTPTVQPKQSKSNPTLTTLYDIGAFNSKKDQPEITTKRSTLVPYTKAYSSVAKEPYTRPGISLLKNFIEKEKNKTIATTTTETPAHRVTQRSDVFQVKPNKVTVETKETFESATKIPQTTRSDFTASASSAAYEVYSTPAETTTVPNYKQRRERLMRKLNFGDLASTDPTSPDSASEKFYGDQPNRPGLVVPPSLTPKTLHTLAIYYATALDNLSTTTAPPESEETTINYDEYAAAYENLGGLFSPLTVNKYTHLFGSGTETPEMLENIKMDPNVTYNEILDDLTVQQSQNGFATSPQIRELAQVFTHALSAYLQDPIQFRKVLSDIRPTAPSFGDIYTIEDTTNTEPTTTVNEEDDEILGFSDDSKSRSPLIAIREPKQLNFGTEYPTTVQYATTTPVPITAEVLTATPQLTTTRRPYICCGRISASYTSPTTPKDHSTTQIPFTNNVSSDGNPTNSETTTENSYTVPRYGGFQNNTVNDYSPYGVDAGKPLSDYVASTNLPTAWGVDSTAPVTDADINQFESKKLKTTTGFPTTTPVYFTETDASIELENDEELQRAQSHSFVNPQSNSIRHGKQLNTEEKATTIKKPSEELEAPTLPDFDESTVNTTPQATTYKPETSESTTTVSPIQTSYFTSPDTERITNDFQWPSTLQNWQSTILDPITLNDNLSPENLRQLADQTNSWPSSTTPTPTLSYATTNEPVVSTTYNVEVSSASSKHEERHGRLLRDHTATEPAQELTTVTDEFVEKAKEIMGGMNATTTQKLMNVMKKTKSKTVKRLILLLVQTCDDDHNSTAEASKKALLEALMAVSQKDMDEIAKVEKSTELPANEAETEEDKSNYVRRTDQVLERQQVAKTDRRGKSLNFDASAINSLSNSISTESVKTTEAVTEAVSSTTPIPVRSTVTSRRGFKKFLSRASPVEVQAIKEVLPDSPIAAARVAAPEDLKTTDTRALELLRSLYTIASRWG